MYRIDWGQNSQYTRPVRLPEYEKVYVAGRLLFEGGKFVATDRLGSVIYKCAGGLAMQNGGFETGATNWTPYGGAQHEPSTVARSGYLSLRQTTTTTNTGIYQDISGLIPGKQYSFVAWVRAETDYSAMGRLRVSDTAGNNMVMSSPNWGGTNWWAVQAFFTATAEGKARVRLEKMSTVDALLWDDVEMAPMGDTCAKAVKLRYHPYGQEVGTATANDVTKFGTYTRDSGSGLDYAMNRYYQSTWGRFTTADPYRESASPGNPASWNRYSYVEGDPVNSTDSTGLYLDQCAATEEITLFSPCWARMQRQGTLDQLWSSGAMDIYAGMPDSIRQSMAQYNAQVDAAFNPVLGCYCDFNGGSIPDVQSTIIYETAEGSDLQSILDAFSMSNNAIVGTISLPFGDVLGVTIEIPFSYTPSSSTGTIGFGLAFGSPGFNVGTVPFGNATNPVDVLKGWAWGFQAQADPLVGMQIVYWNGNLVWGPTMGTFGGSAGLSYSWVIEKEP